MLEEVGVNNGKDPCEPMVRIEVAVERWELRCPGRACLVVIGCNEPTGCHRMSYSLTLAGPSSWYKHPGL